jgi:hypothetical protein
MNRLQRLWHYCPLPLKRRRGLLQRLAAALHLPPLDKLVSVPPHTLGLVSLLTSTLVFCFGTIATATLITGALTGISVYLTSPFLTVFSIPIFLGVWAVVHSILTASQRKGARIFLFTILALLIITPGFTICLTGGVFNSITLSNDSFIDLSHCTVFLDIHNIGIKDVVITNVTVGHLVWTFPSLNSVWWNLKKLPRGQNTTLTLVYAHPYDGMPGMYSNLIEPDGPYDLEGRGINPATFLEGEAYPVKVQTDGPITFGFQVEAKYLKHEEIRGIHARAIFLHNRTEENESYCVPEIVVWFDMPATSLGFIHSITVGPLTLTFEQPILIPRNNFGSTQQYTSIMIDYRVNASGQYSAFVSDVWPSSVVEPVLPNQPLTSPPFKIGETYSLTVQTMENNNYTATITMKVT